MTHVVASGNIIYLNDIFNDAHWNQIENIIRGILSEDAALEVITAGEGKLAKSYFSLKLYKFIKRENGKSIKRNCKYTAELLNIIQESELFSKLNNYIKNPVSILRMQLNIMEPGGFVDAHTDSQRDSAFQYSLLIRPSCDYTGGELVLTDELNQKKIVEKNKRSVTLMSSHTLHEVTPVTSGERFTICLFMGN